MARRVADERSAGKVLRLRREVGALGVLQLNKSHVDDYESRVCINEGRWR